MPSCRRCPRIPLHPLATASPRARVPPGQSHSRSGADNDAAHPLEAAVGQVQALGGELHLPALEVLLLEDDDLGAEGRARAGHGAACPGTPRSPPTAAPCSGCCGRAGGPRAGAPAVGAAGSGWSCGARGCTCTVPPVPGTVELSWGTLTARPLFPAPMQLPSSTPAFRCCPHHPSSTAGLPVLSSCPPHRAPQGHNGLVAAPSPEAGVWEEQFRDLRSQTRFPGRGEPGASPVANPHRTRCCSSSLSPLPRELLPGRASTGRVPPAAGGG